MMPQKKLLLVLILVLVILATACGTMIITPTLNTPTQLTASGTIETDLVRVAAQVGGRIESLAADEGDEVTAGQVLARLDDVLLRAELKKAEAALAMAQAQLAQARAGARPADLRKAEGAVKLARATRDGAKVAWEDAQAARDNPQELLLKIAAARSQLAIAEARLAQAMAGKDAAQVEHDLWANVADLVTSPTRVCIPLPDGTLFCQDFYAGDRQVKNAFYQWNLSSQRLAGLWDTIAQAKAGRDAAQASLDALLAQRDNPLAANAQVDGAWAQYQAAEAALQEAEATLALARAGATTEQIRMAEANVRQAEAAVQALQVTLDKMTLRAPIAGLVTTRSVQEGEMAIPGVSVFTLANLEQVQLTLYIPETRIARVKVGQTVNVRVDSFPGRAFTGRVSYIAPQAEFTPRTVQTEEERARMVFAVKVAIANPDHALKPGMPADAVIEEAQQ